MADESSPSSTPAKSYAVPVAVGLGAVALVGVGLALHARAAKAKTLAAAASAPPPAQLPSVAPGGLGGGVPKAQSPATLPSQAADYEVDAGGTLIPTALGQAAQQVGFSPAEQAQVAQMAAQLSAQMAQPAAVTTLPRARVITNDPPPSGDLVVRSGPSATAPQIGGAEKNGLVTVLGPMTATFTKIQWPGGSRWPAVTGYVRTAFLQSA